MYHELEGAWPGGVRVAPPPSSGIEPWWLRQARYFVHKQSGVAALLIIGDFSGAIPLLLARRAGALRVPVTLMSFALLADHKRTGIRRRLWSAAVAGADHLVVQSPGQVEQVTRHFARAAGTTHCIPPGVDSAWLRANAESGSVIPGLVLATGSPQRDYETLIMALPREAELLIIANDGVLSRVASVAKGRPNVALRRIVSPAELRELTVRASVVAVPLVDTRFSAGQLTVLEALAVGKIVVTSDVEVISAVYKNPNLKFAPPGNVAAWNAALQQALCSEPDPSGPSQVLTEADTLDAWLSVLERAIQ